ncbi:MAG TPA: flagella basal body P-ring formation protein FlgA, partial [Bryobacteraceae bacterium]|nr:flagella basal body P-ring formation protein FlgA [Bryobacteraceae bacterium]
MALPILLAVVADVPPACIAIDSDSVLARDVAAAIPAFAKVPADALLGYVALSGAPRVFHGVDLERLAKNRGLELSGLADVCFERRTFLPNADQIRSAIRDSLKLGGANIEILESSRKPAPSGELVFPKSGAQLPFGTNAQNEIMWHGYVSYGENARFPVWARVRVTASMTRVVTLENLPVAKEIRASQVRVETCEDSPLDETVARNLDEVVGYVPKSSLRAMTVIHRTQIQRPNDVAVGETISVDVYEGAAHLTMEGRAESAGMAGSTIT